MSVQVISGTHVSAEGVPLVGRVVTATPIPKQFVDGRTVDVVPVSTVTASGGHWSLTLVQGVVYDLRIQRWATHTIKVTADSELDFSYYLDLAADTSIPGPISQIALRAGAYTTGRQLQFDTTGRVVASDYAVGSAGGTSAFDGVLPATSEPAGLLTYAAWVAGGRVGYWAWVDISGGGSVPTTSTLSATSTSGLVLGGSSSISAGAVRAATGGLVLGGASAVLGTHAAVSVAITSVGGVVLGGSSPVAYGSYGSTSVSSTGGVVLGGSSPVLMSALRTSVGGLVLGGASPVSTGRPVTSAGGLVLGGVSPVAAGPAVSSVGGQVLGGTSATARGAVRSSTGGFVLGGSSPAVGTANVTSSQSVTSSGGLVLGGTSAVVGTANASTPSAPTGVSASNSPAQLTVTWDAVSGATSYNIYYSTTTTPPGSPQITGATGTSYTIGSGLTAGTGYYVWVSAVNGAGEGVKSAVYGPVSTAAPFSVTDDFNRADGGLGSNWTTLAGRAAPQILSGKVVPPNNLTEAGALYNVATTPAQYAQVDGISMTNSGVLTYAAVLVRANMTNGNNVSGAFIFNADHSVGMNICVNGSNPASTQYELAIVNVSAIRISVVNTQYICELFGDILDEWGDPSETGWFQFALPLDFSDAGFANGSVGFALRGNVSVDSFSAGSL